MPIERTPPSSIYVMAYDLCDELDVVGPSGVFAAANFFLSQKPSHHSQPRGKTFTVRVVAVDGAGAVEAQGPEGPLYFVKGIQGPDDPQLESDVRDFIDFRYRSPIIGPP